MDTAFLSAAVALLIFTLSQFFIHLRERQNILRLKLEELFDAMNNLSECCVHSYHAAQHYDKSGEEEDLLNKMYSINKSLYKPRTLTLLYFPYIIPAWDEVVVNKIFKYTESLLSG